MGAIHVAKLKGATMIVYGALSDEVSPLRMLRTLAEEITIRN